MKDETTLKISYKEIGHTVSLKELKKNDIFYMEYERALIKFRVHRVFCDAVLARSVKWLKRNTIFIDETYDNRRKYYAGRMSKFRAFWLL